jgi:hypothetical protein
MAIGLRKSMESLEGGMAHGTCILAASDPGARLRRGGAAVRTRRNASKIEQRATILNIWGTDDPAICEHLKT